MQPSLSVLIMQVIALCSTMIHSTKRLVSLVPGVYEGGIDSDKELSKVFNVPLPRSRPMRKACTWAVGRKGPEDLGDAAMTYEQRSESMF
ncbi:hypothetical protein HO173_006600 [Letharia columbiana]|uniref:Secreted protein n=1 Tax=Letharia columbiana TaxID=112416 RepID=A0A8H6FV70_9LECA|nr:uncharacterized protein HO173_006600 [Letharia columbiana]KAF6235404.1 hypothetical protein HO173_006600 [Letharia columbiana]